MTGTVLCASVEPLCAADPAVGMDLYRSRTIGLLRRYFRMSIEVGRLPSVLGREFFRAHVSRSHVHTFEDTVIFVHDMERCLQRLDEPSRQLLGRIVLQEYSEAEAANLLGCSLRHVERHLPLALDRLSAILLSVRMLERLPEVERQAPVAEEAAQRGPEGAADKKTAESCQGARNVIFAASA